MEQEGCQTVLCSTQNIISSADSKTSWKIKAVSNLTDSYRPLILD